MSRFASRCIRAALALAVWGAAAAAHAQGRDITPPDDFVVHVVAHPVDRGRLIALTWRGSRVSNDAGRTWSEVNPSAPKSAERIFVHPGAPGVVFLQTAHIFNSHSYLAPAHHGGDLFRSQDFGAAWTLLRSGSAAVGEEAVSPFAALPGNPAHIFATIRSIGGCVDLFCRSAYRPIDLTVVESRDGGASWTPAAAGIPAQDAYFQDPAAPMLGAVGPTPAARNRLALIRPDGVYVSDDAARSWRRIANPALGGFEWVKPDPLRIHISYALRGAQIMRTDDGGDHWKIVLETGRTRLPGLVPDLLLEAGNSDRVWAVTERGLLFSEDRGESWRNLGFEAEAQQQGTRIVFSGGAGPIAISAATPRTAYVVWHGRLQEVIAPGDGTVPVVEFLDVANKRYWLTANPGEALAVDYANEVSVARRTGAAFRVWSNTYFDGMAPVCRFQGDPSRGLHSRFITLEGAECAAVEQSGKWVLQGRGEFAAFLPTGPNACRGDQLPLRRFFNGLADVNHRYVVDEAVAAEMTSRGWIEEGIAMCVAAR